MFHSSIASLLALTLATSTLAQSVRPTGTGSGRPGTTGAPFPLANGTLPGPNGSGTGTGTGRPFATGALTTYTYETTAIFTITECPPQITNCPARSSPITVTASFDVTTTAPPPNTVKTEPQPVATVTVPPFGGFPGGCPLASTVYSTVTVFPASGGPVLGSNLPGSTPVAPIATQPSPSQVPHVTTLTVVPVIAPTPSTHGLSSVFVFTNSSGNAKTALPGSGTAFGTAAGTALPSSETPCTTITEIRTVPLTTITLGPGLTTTPCTTITEILTIPIATVTAIANGTTFNSTSRTTPIGTGVTISPSGRVSNSAASSIPTSSALNNGTISSTFRRVRA